MVIKISRVIEGILLVLENVVFILGVSGVFI